MSFDVQTIFYTVGILTMLTWLAILLVLLGVVWRIKTIVDKVKKINSVINEVKKIRNFFKK